MPNLIPHFIHEQFTQQIYHGRLQAVTMSVDISGFTSLTETLMQHKKDGAETLTEVLQQVFYPLTAEVYRQGGFISGFAGDAVTALFPLSAGEAVPSSALQTAWFIQRFFAEQGQLETRYGCFEMGIKVGLSLGEVEWGILGTGARYTYLFRGPAIDGCARAEQLAQEGEIIADGAIYPHIQARVTAIPVGDHFKLIPDVSAPMRPPSSRPPSRAAPPSLSQEALTPFVLDAAIDFALSGAQGEFRNVASVFISFETVLDDETLNRFVSQVLELAVQYGGYFKDMTFSYKGTVIVCLFGAPATHENDLARAADFLLALQERSPGVNWRVGLTYGTVYAGLMGGAECCEYTAIGDVVNLAARLMQRAAWGEVWMSALAAQFLQQAHRVEFLGEFTFKGKHGELPAYRLAGRRAVVQATFFAGEMIGREAELAELEAFIQPIFGEAPAGHPRFAGVATIHGDAGMGKSRLAYELRQCLVGQVLPSRHGRRRPEPVEGGDRGVGWFNCPADEILRQSLNPFKHFLRRYFDQLPEATAERNKARLEQRLDRLIHTLSEPAPPSIFHPLSSNGVHPEQLDPPAELGTSLAHDKRRRGAQVNSLIAELDRTRSFLGALVDLHWLGSLYEQLEPQLRFENTLTAFKALILAESMNRPVVLQLEDLQWFDADSQELVKLLTRNIEAFPVAILCTSRYRDDGSQVTLAVDPSTPQQVIELNTLSAESVRSLAKQVLGGKIADELAVLLSQRTGGNPFFVEQLLLDLRERGALERRPEPAEGPAEESVWVLPESATEVPTRIGAVLIARLDRLAGDVRQVVQTAAVLGREFEVQVLSRMLRGDTRLPAKVKQAEAERIWTALSELRYIFRHALMRDAAYEMQLWARLRELHRLAAEAIEQVYATDLAPHYPDLAYHYGQAEDVERERHYTRLAGEQAAAQFANAAAVGYFSRALDLTPEADYTGRYALLLARERIYDLQGVRETQNQDLQALEQLAEASDDDLLRAEVALRQANYAFVISDYSSAATAAQAAIGLAQTIGQQATGDLAAETRSKAIRLEAVGYYWWGRTLCWQGDYESAQSQLEQALTLSRGAGLPRVEADSLRNLGIISFYSGKPTEAKSYYEQGLHIYRQMGDRRGESSSLNNLGLLSGSLEDYPQGRGYYEQALRINQEIGDRRGEGLARGNLGFISLRLGSYVTAEHQFERALDICRDIGDREVGIWVQTSLILLSHLLGDDQAAWERGQQVLRLVRESPAPRIQGMALNYTGHALVGLGRLDEAANAYRESVAIWQQLAERSTAMEPLAGLARVCLAQANLSQAQAHVEEILSHLPGAPVLTGTAQPFRVYWTCYRVLRANQDPRAQKILTSAHTLLQERAAKIDDEEARRSFLENVATHREIIAEFARGGLESEM